MSPLGEAKADSVVASVVRKLASGKPFSFSGDEEFWLLKAAEADGDMEDMEGESWDAVSPEQLARLKARAEKELVKWLARQRRQVTDARLLHGDGNDSEDSTNTNDADMAPPYGEKMKKSESIADTIRASFHAVEKDGDGLTLGEACDQEIAARASELTKHDLLLDPSIARTRIMKSAPGSALMTLRFSPMADKPFGEALEEAATYTSWARMVADRLRPAGGQP